MAKKVAKRKAEIAPAAPAAPLVDLSYIVEGLRPLAVPIEGLRLDPRNARQHDERSISSIAASFREFGIRKPATVRRDTQTVIAGNGSIQAAKLNGWTHFPIVLVEDDDQTATKFAIADNRTAELSTWDQEQLASLMAEVDVIDDELRRMFDDLTDSLPDLTKSAAASAQAALDELDGDSSTGDGTSPAIVGRQSKEKWQIVISCKDKEDQQRLLKRFTDDGLQCTAGSK